jgi:HlyD family secretion protein
VPGSAIRDAATPAPYVLVLRGDRVERREVRLGVRIGERIEIASGLEADESVVVDGGSGLTPGQRVRPHELTLDEASRAL